MLMIIRGETVKYSKVKAKRSKEKELIAQINSAASTIFSKSRSEECVSGLRTCKEQLEKFRKPIINGLIVRSRTRWHDDVEKPSKYFLSLEKRNAMKKNVPILTLGEQNITRASKILKTFTGDLSKKVQQI